MMNKTKTLIALTSILVASFSGAVVAGTTLGQPLSTTLPFGDGGLIGLAAAGIIGAVWLARRIKK
ncbi:MAG: hypothetical protein COA46_11195 [Porticoccaceae bacterium]|nr:MAG: hypothetical protein COA46_11195 [Porticoccaceae bacterium]